MPVPARSGCQCDGAQAREPRASRRSAAICAGCSTWPCRAPLAGEPECHAAVGHDLLPGDVFRSRRGEEQGKRHDVIRLTHAMYRSHARGCRLHVGARVRPQAMSVAKTPGAIALAVIPQAASSSATECIKCLAPAFAARQAEPIAVRATVAATDVVTMILPDRRGRIWRAAARAVPKAPLRVDLDYAAPALAAGALERALPDPRLLAAVRTAGEANAGTPSGRSVRLTSPRVLDASLRGHSASALLLRRRCTADSALPPGGRGSGMRTTSPSSAARGTGCAGMEAAHGRA
jgi:hypothetical protein